jgi:hypothetical protein
VQLGPQQILAEKALVAVCQALDAADFAAAFAAGKQMSVDELRTRLAGD